MRIDGTEFGSIAIDGRTYQFDVVIRLSGEVVKRKKKLSKKYFRLLQLPRVVGDANRGFAADRVLALIPS